MPKYHQPKQRAPGSPIYPAVVLPIYMDWEIFQEGTGKRKGRASFTHKTLPTPHTPPT